MKKEKLVESRRNLLKSALAGSGAVIAGKNLPENWAKPVVDSVMLPAHAQTSIQINTQFNFFGQNVAVASIGSDTSFAESITDSLINDAHAQAGQRPIIEMSAAVNGSMATVLFTPSQDPVFLWALFQSNLPTDGTPGTVILGPGGDCGAAPFPDPTGADGPQAVRIVGYTLGDPTITIEITGGNSEGSIARNFVLQQGPGTASAVTCNSIPSDRNIKENFKAVDSMAVLKHLAMLPVETWNYQFEDPEVRHIGPMAQDFAAAFAVGGDDKTINMVDANGVAVAAIQALYKLNEEKDIQIAKMQDQLAELSSKISR